MTYIVLPTIGRKMKILLTLDFPPEVGGIQRYLYDIVKHTYNKNDLVLTIGKDAKSDLLLPCPIKRIPIFINKKISLLPLFFIFVYYFIKNRKDIIVFCGNIYTAIIPSIVSIIYKIDYNIYCYGTELIGIKQSKLFYSFLKNIVFKQPATLYYLSSTTKKLIESLTIRCRCIKELPRIELPDYKIEEKNYNKEKIDILSVGRLVPHKGHSILIKAFSLLKVNIDWQAKIIGDGLLYKKLFKEIEKLSLSKYITIERNVSESQLQDYYIQADIFVFPSIETTKGVEGFGIALLEAMAYGAAIVASKSGGIEDVFTECREAAILVPPEDPFELCRAITNLIENSESRQKMALMARKHLESKYVWR